MKNSLNKLPSLKDYEERIFRDNDIECLRSLDNPIQSKGLNLKELKLLFNFLRKIYTDHEFNKFKLKALSLMTKIVMFYVIDHEIIHACSVTFRDALTNRNVRFKRRVTNAYFEIIHRHYYLLSDECIRDNLMYLNNLYENEEDENTKCNILRVFRRMLELELIPADLRLDFYNKMYEELHSQKENVRKEVIQILSLLHDQKLPINHDHAPELIQLLKLNASNINENKLQLSLQHIGILIKHRFISERQELFDFIFPFLSRSSDLIQNEALACIYYLLVNKDLNEAQKKTNFFNGSTVSKLI